MSSTLEEVSSAARVNVKQKCWICLLFRLPDVSAGLGQADVGEDAAYELAGEFGGVDGFQVEGGDDREDGGTGFGGQRHIAQVDAVEGRFAYAEDEGTALFECDVSGAGNEWISEAEGDGGECTHGAWEDDHAAGRMAAAGDGRADVGVGVLDGFDWLCAEKFFQEVDTTGDVEFFGEDAEGVFACDEVDTGDSGVGLEGAE